MKTNLRKVQMQVKLIPNETILGHEIYYGKRANATVV